MTFIRHLAAAMLVVAVIIASAVACEHGTGTGTQGTPTQGVIAHDTKVPSGQITVRNGRAGAIRGHFRPDPGFSLSRVQDLIRTGMIEAVFMTIVVTASAVRRQRRRVRRAAYGGAS